MTEHFNLLPTSYAERVAERRSAGIAAAALIVLMLSLTAASVAQGRQLSGAERKRDAEQARNAELQTRVRTLAPYRQLTNGIVGRERLVAAAMQTQVSWATVLTSLSTTFPADTSLTSLTAESTLPAFGAVPPAEPGNESLVAGSTTLKGYSVENFTPGLQRMLQLLDAVTGLSGPRLQVGEVEKMGETPVTTFEGTTFIDGSALSGRYAHGLPPEDDVELPRVGAGPPPAASPGTSTRAAE